MTFSRRSDPEAILPAGWAPTASPADRAALRAARRRAESDDPLAVLAVEVPFPVPPRRTTAAGRTPFRLPPET
jgi:hypothetical protein